MTHPSRKSTLDNTGTTIWQIYNYRAKLRDKTLLKDWESSIHSLLLFSGIFSAVLTALCVESRKMLEPDRLDSIFDTLQYIAQRDTIHPPPLPSNDFKAPEWAVDVNTAFFASLTCSMVAALFSVTCLAWVGEYDAGLEEASRPEDGALRRHYRYRGTTNWFMDVVIAFLPMLLYTSVLLFFKGLIIWFDHVNPTVRKIPFIGVLIWASVYVGTTLLAIFWPSAPFRTPLSKLLYRILALAFYCLWLVYHAILLMLEPLFAPISRKLTAMKRKIKDFVNGDESPDRPQSTKFTRSIHHIYTAFQAWCKRIKNPMKMARQEFFHRMEIKQLDAYPWMTPGRTLWQSLHSHVWERGRVSQDNTIHISALAWLANSMDLSEQSRLDYLLLLKEMNKLDAERLSCLVQPYNHAPWMHIFNLILDTETSSDDRNAILDLLAQLLVKMARYPTLFMKMIEEMKDEMIVGFLRQSTQLSPLDRNEAQNRLESIVALLLHPHWQQLGSQQPIDAAFKTIHDCLMVIKKQRRQKIITVSSASWLFTLCRLPDDNQVHDAAWNLMKSSAEFLGVMPNAFKNKELRVYYIEQFVRFVDLQLAVVTANNPESPKVSNDVEWIWRISKEVSNSGHRDIPLKIFVRYLYPRLIQSDESPKYDDTIKLLDHCVELTNGHSPLRAILVILRNRLPSVQTSTYNFQVAESDDAWKDEAWLYAIRLWFNTDDDVAFSRKDVENAFWEEDNEENQKLQEQVFSQMVLAEENPVLKQTIDRIFKGRGSRMSENFWKDLFKNLEQNQTALDEWASLIFTLDMPKNRLLAIFDCFLNPQVVDSHPVTNSVAEALLGALKKHLRPVDPHSSGLAPLKLQKQVLVRRATSITSAIGECLVRLGIQATAPAYAKLPSSVSALLQSIGRALQGMANTDGLVDQSMLHTCVYLACFIADNYVPKEDEEDVAKRLKNILDELEKMPSSQQPGSPTDEEDITKRLKNILEKMPNSQQPGSPTTLSPDDSVRGHLNLLGEQIRGTYSSRSPSNYHSQLPGSTRNQNSTLSPDSTSSGPLPSDTRSNEQHDSIPMIVDTSHSTNEPPVVDPPSTMATGNGYVTLDSDPTASNGTRTALGITFSAS